MKIIVKSKGMAKADLYKLMSPESFTNMREKVGKVLKIEKFSIHEEPDTYGGVKKILSIETESGEVVVSASRTLVMEFEKLIAIFGVNAIDEIAIIESATGSGNDVLSCRYTALNA